MHGTGPSRPANTVVATQEERAFVILHDRKVPARGERTKGRRGIDHFTLYEHENIYRHVNERELTFAAYSTRAYYINV